MKVCELSQSRLLNQFASFCTDESKVGVSGYDINKTGEFIHFPLRANYRAVQQNLVVF